MDAQELLDRLNDYVQNIQCQHEIPSKGCSTYNWGLFYYDVLLRLLSEATTPEVPKGETGEYDCPWCHARGSMHPVITRYKCRNCSQTMDNPADHDQQEPTP